MQHTKVILLVTLPLLFIGCSQKAEPKYTYKPPLLPIEIHINEDDDYIWVYDGIFSTPFGDFTKQDS